MPQKAAGATKTPRLRLGRALRRRRLELGLTLVKLADRCDKAGVPVAHSHLSKLERGHYTPRPGLRLVLTELLGLDAEVFETEVPEAGGTP
ncbi:helix-turn-helix domain-containing protein [Streptomyces manipurensis]|uniref:helix-turn-helix domain-containing protein n=1 Tax=Streptomyces manipurensis TaxID=1077945 RepID=UPI003C6FE3A1